MIFIEKITLVVDVVPVDLDVESSEGIEVHGAVGFYHSKEDVITFDVANNKRKEFEFMGRQFSIHLTDQINVATPFEYVFGISELDS